jgi:hypothetical protein
LVYLVVVQEYTYSHYQHGNEFSVFNPGSYINKST